MEAFKTHRGKIVTVDRSNIDTDQIIAKQFLKSIKRTGFGESLFYDWRFKPDGKADPDFPLNQARFQGASILVARNNFGCGSSREHAVWSVQQYGFKVVVAPSRETSGGRIPGFADIFRNNSHKNALLTIELKENEVNEIFKAVNDHPGLEATADLTRQTLTIHTLSPREYAFEFDPAIKERLVQGLDDIGITLAHEAAIRDFETRHNAQV